MVVAGALELDRAVHRHQPAAPNHSLATLVVAGAGEIDAQQSHAAQRVEIAAVDPRGLAGECVGRWRLGRAEVGGAGRRLARVAERTQALRHRAQPLLVLEVDAVDDLDEVAQVNQRVGEATRAHVGLGAHPQHRGIDHVRLLRSGGRAGRVGLRRCAAGRAQPLPAGTAAPRVQIGLHVVDDLPGLVRASAVADRVGIDHVDAMQAVEVRQLERAAGQDEHPVDRCTRRASSATSSGGSWHSPWVSR